MSNKQRLKSYLGYSNIFISIFRGASIVHTGGTITLPDAQKVDELREFGGKTIAFQRTFIMDVARKMHPLIKNSVSRVRDKFLDRLLDNIVEKDRKEIEKLFLVKSSNSGRLFIKLCQA